MKDELIDSIHQAGFDVVYEQYDFLRSVASDDYICRHDHSMFVGIKS